MQMNNITVLNIVIAKIWGGGEQYVYDTAKALKDNGCSIFIAVDKHNEDMIQRFSQVAIVIPCNLLQAGGLFALSELTRIVKKYDIDIINCHSGHAALLCIFLKLFTDAKLIMIKHNALPSKKDLYHKWQRAKTDAFVCVSRLVYDLQTKNLAEDEKRKYHLIYNGIDENKFNKYTTKSFLEEDVFAIGYAGRISANKGIDILIEAVSSLSKKYNNWRLYLAGSDEHGYLKKLLKYIEEHDLHGVVSYVGHVEDMEKFYKMLNVFVLPSVVREAFGLVLCEAMYCQIPVITTDSGAQKEIIDNDKDGLIVQASDKVALEKALLRLYEQRDVGNMIAINAKKKVETHFTAKKCASNLMKLYENILEGAQKDEIHN